MELNRFKNKQPFKVPQGYFDELESNITRMLPATPATAPKRSGIRILPIARYAACAAAIATALIMGITMYNTGNNSSMAATDEYYDEYIDDMLNNYPIDDYTFYCCLTGNDNY